MTNEQWHQWRREGIGSSDAAVILGVSPWRTPKQLWEEKVYGISEQLDNSSMARGRQLEPMARTWFENHMNVSVFPVNKINRDHDFIRASLDGLDMEEKIMVEIKCPNREDHIVAVNKMVPEKYIPQLQHQLLVTGLDGMYYCSFDGCNGAIVEVARDNAYIQSMLEKEQEFWDMVLTKKAPDMTERDYVSMEDNPEWRMLADKWVYLSESMKTMEEEEKNLRKLIIELSNQRNAHGKGLKICKSTCEGSIDYKQVMQDHPEINWESYRKKSFNKWTFRATA